MPTTVTEQFIESLSRLEAARDPEAISSLFAETSEVGNVIAPDRFHGTDGARKFWQEYRNTFQDVRSSFRNRIVDGNRVALEWSSEGTLSDGSPFRYEGVSILELNGGKIQRFHAYFDAHSLGRELQATARA